MQSVGLSTNVVVDNRPVTRQGLTGMHTKQLGPGRQIADDKYFVNELRNRIREITQETENMRREVQDIEEGNVKHSKYQRQYDETISEVHTLEGELADINLALDKYRTNTSVDDIKEQFERVKARNTQEAATVDDVFMQTQSTNNKRIKVEEMIADIHETVASRLNELGEDVASQYKGMQEEQLALQAAINDRETKLHMLTSKITDMRNKLQSQEYQTHQEGLRLRKEKKKLLQQRQELEEDTDSSLTPEELKERIRTRVRDLNSDVEQQQRSLKSYDASVEKLQDQIRLKEQDLAEARKHAAKAKKYEAVYERDTKMQEFLDDFENIRREEVENMTTLKTTIVALMKHISSQLSASQNLPDKEQLHNMKEELSFKAQKLQNSQQTLVALEEDLKVRKEELHKIEQLDKKINKELRSLKDKMEGMNIEMSQFKSEDELQTESEDAKKHLSKEKVRTSILRDASKQQVKNLARAYNSRKEELAGNETMKKIDALEQKLRSYSTTVFSLQDFIQSRKRESDYETIRVQVMDICSTINKHIAAQVNAR